MPLFASEGCLGLEPNVFLPENPERRCHGTPILVINRDPKLRLDSFQISLCIYPWNRGGLVLLSLPLLLVIIP